MLNKNQTFFAVEITDLNNLGYGVARVDGITVFVAGAVTGDVCDIRVIKTARSWAAAAVERIVAPSPYRLPPHMVCPHAKQCGGCVYAQVRYSHELSCKHGRVVFALKKAGIADVAVADVLYHSTGAHTDKTGEAGEDGVIDRYRNKAQYPVGTDRTGHVVCGFYASRSHRIIPVSDCYLQPEAFGKIASAVTVLAEQYGIAPYDEITGTGLFRHIYLRSSVAGEMMLILVLNGTSLPHADAFCAMLRQKFPAVVSFGINQNTVPGNVILGERYQMLFGEDYITDTLCGLSFRISPQSFYQVDHDTAELLYRRALELLAPTGNEVLLDLYCGTGTIGLSMAHRVKQLYGVEIEQRAVENAQQNALANGILNASFFAGDAAAFRQLVPASAVDCVIVDPPRRGLEPPVIDDIAALAPKTVIYISCDPDTLARDLCRFATHHYHTDTVYPVNMFARTGHCECITRLTRARKP